MTKKNFNIAFGILLFVIVLMMLLSSDIKLPELAKNILTWLNWIALIPLVIILVKKDDNKKNK